MSQPEILEFYFYEKPGSPSHYRLRNLQTGKYVAEAHASAGITKIKNGHAPVFLNGAATTILRWLKLQLGDQPLSSGLPAHFKAHRCAGADTNIVYLSRAKLMRLMENYRQT
jgi:hypothetical protein